VNSLSKIRIGLIGAGFAAEFHAQAYARIKDPDAVVVAVAARHGDRAAALAARHAIPRFTDDYRAFFDDPEIDAVDVCVPNALHAEIVIAAARAGKHVFCEKPLTGFYGGGSTPKRQMLSEALARADDILAAVEAAGVKLAYGENWVHAPAFQKAGQLALASKGAILEIRAEEGHSGSHAAYSRSWAQAGGGSLVRLGSHPLGGALSLKAQEGRARSGRPIRVAAVTAEVADLSKAATAAGEGRNYLAVGWQDVENWSTMLLTFEDGTRATIFSSDIVLGGMEDRLEIFLSNCRIRFNITHSTLCEAYAPDPNTFAGEYLVEKLETKAGWSFPTVDEHWLLGYPQELRNFVEAVALDRSPLADGRLGRDVVEVMYAAYVSAEEGQRVALPVRESADRGGRKGN
jgi:predicted dehydrogenase